MDKQEMTTESIRWRQGILQDALPFFTAPLVRFEWETVIDSVQLKAQQYALAVQPAPSVAITRTIPPCLFWHSRPWVEGY